MSLPTLWKIFPDNDSVWLSMLHDCAQAKESIVLEQFIFTADDFGRRLIDICAERAKNGVKVRFLWDAAGSFTFWGSNIIAELQSKNIELVFWRTIVPGYYKVVNFRSWLLRNHRRTLVIDGKIGYTGSICVRDSTKNWRDTNVRLEGLVVKEMQNAFERMWARVKHFRPLPKRKKAGDSEFRYVTNYPAPGRRHIYRELIKTIKNAKHYIYLTTPYFVPTHRLAQALKLAAMRGVDVRIIIPQTSDHFAVDLGARSFFSQLLEFGVRIFLYSNGTMIHSKVTIIDDKWISIGTMNLDQISLLYNFEANIISNNLGFAEEAVSHFVHDMHNSKEVIRNEWNNRSFLEKLPELAITLVRKFL